MSYATVTDVEARVTRDLSADEKAVCEKLLEDAAVLINAYDGEGNGFPIGTQSGSMSALGYSQSWSVPSTGANGELYLSKVEKTMLGVGNRIGTYSPVEGLT